MNIFAPLLFAPLLAPLVLDLSIDSGNETVASTDEPESVLVEPVFVEVGDSLLSGVTTTCGSTDKNYIIEVNGGGLVVEDFNGDGRLDVVVIDGSTIERVNKGEPGFPPRLFLANDKGGFDAAGEQWAMSGGRWGMGGAAGDVNGDGWLDLFVTEWGRDRLFLNRAGAGFEEVTDKAGFKGRGWSTSAAFLDYDGDSHLDLVVIGYLAFRLDEISSRTDGKCSWKGHDVMCGPEGLIPLIDRLYKGKGDGTFQEVSVAAGFRVNAAGYGLGVTTLDYDNDGDTDLYVANDSTPNHLWSNNGDGTFKEIGVRRNVGHDANGKEQAGMGIGSGDVNGDGRVDLFVTNFSGENNSLYLSKKKTFFREKSAQTGIMGPSLGRLGWGTGLYDFDLDGDLDIFVLNGHVYPQASMPGTDTSYPQGDQFFRQMKDGKFREEALSDGQPSVSRAGLAADLDGDGALEILALDLGGKVRVLKNVGAVEGAAWLGVRLRGTRSNRFGIGARVEVEASGKTFVRELRSAAGFQASGPLEAHFGLGRVEKLDRVTVRWPSGAISKLEDVEPNQRLVVEEPVQ